MPAPIITVENLGKDYILGHHGQDAPYRTLRDTLSGWFHKSKIKNPAGPSRLSPQGEKSEIFSALNDISFEVQQGEVLGIIGRNGAGKSTLLKILSRITDPTRGRVRLRGRVASLLEVGTGFHPELTGRENIFLNGAILGMNRAEIRKKFDEIVVFSGVDQFLDTPVKRYSSGMYVRLAFAVAAHLEPEILIIDEVLAVGDAAFQKKCLGKMKEFSTREGRTVLFVSHNMTAIQSLCSQVMVMEKGRVSHHGEVNAGVRSYMNASGSSPAAVQWNSSTAPGNESVRLHTVRARSLRTDGQDDSLMDRATPIDIEVGLTVLQPSHFHVTFHFITDQGVTAFTSGGACPRGSDGETPAGKYLLICHVPAHLLNEGGYSIRLLLIMSGNRWELDLNDLIGFDVKDLSPREIGAWQGREPGPVRPDLAWTCVVKA